MSKKTSKARGYVTVQIPLGIHEPFKELVKSKGQTMTWVLAFIISDYVSKHKGGFDKTKHLLEQYEIAQGHLSDKGVRELLYGKGK